MGCMDFICGGVLERYPRLRMAFLEAGGLWVPYWLARLDEFYGKIAHLVPKLKMKPSEYFRRQCFCSAEPDDISLKVAASLNADDFLMWASDYLHYDCIVKAGASTLGQIYTNLTGKNDGFAAFGEQLASNFPPGTPSGLTTDNPYPLP